MTSPPLRPVTSSPERSRRISRRSPAEPLTADRVAWSELGHEFLRTWGYPRGKRMPEHLELLGQTGSGKSFFEASILHARARLRGSHIVVIATKPADETLEALKWPIIHQWPPGYGQNQVIFWPKAKGLDSAGQAKQREAIHDALTRLWVPRSNTIVVFDEIAYLQTELGLRVPLTRYYREARTLGITIVASTQRPQGVTRYMHSESGWTVCFAPKDEDDAERMSQVLGSRKGYLDVLQSLNRSKYEFLMVRNLTGERFISHIEK